MARKPKVAKLPVDEPAKESVPVVKETKMSKLIKLPYGDWGGFNSPKTNERKVELPLAFWFMKNYSDNLVELGEVTVNYVDPEHTIYDLMKQRDSTICMDFSDVDYTGNNVVSVSTIEHVGNGDYGYTKDDKKALNLLKKISSQAKNYLLTFPVGFNRDLENTIAENKIEYILFVRDENNNWKQTDEKNFKDYEYNSPYGAGNAVAVLTNLDFDFTFGD